MTRSTAAMLTVALIAVAAGIAVVAIERGDAEPAAASTTSRPPAETEPPVATDPSDTAPPSTSPPTTGPSTTASPSSGYEPVFEDGQCEFDHLTEREPRCGWLVVPEDRSDPDGNQVRLHVAVFPSDDPDVPDDPILFLDGGPGGETLEALRYSLETTWSGYLANRDVIFFDQRGIGLSEPSLECPEAYDYDRSVLEDDLDGADYLEGEFAALEECHQRLTAEGIDLTHYNSATNAADVADLRTALGYDEWNLLGISYGTRLAQTVMRDHPEGIRAVVLDSTYTPDVDLVTESSENFGRALDELYSGCAEDDECAGAFPDLETRVEALADDLDEEPVVAPVRDVLGTETYDVPVDGDTMLGVLFQGLYSEQVIPVLPLMIEELEDGVTSTFSLLAANQLANAAFLSYGMHLSVQCNEEISFADPDEVEAAVTTDADLEEFYRYSSTLGPQAFVVCDLWEAGTAPAVENEPVSSDLPTLIVAGEYDPITPPRWGRHAATTLTDSTFVEFPGVGHGAAVSGDCPEEVTIAFLDDPGAAPNTSCVAGMPGPDFVVPGETNPGSLELVEFSEDVFGVRVEGVRPEAWDPVGPGAWARQSTAVDQTSLVQQASPAESPPEALIAVLGPQLGLEETPQEVGTRDAGGRPWTLYEGELDGFPTDIAISPADGTTAVVIMASDAAERPIMYEAVFLPALEAFSAG